ncbi:MAG: BatA and WFA domain-containing protein [Verrucomicrobiae bacterium]|nr:BatA and WFA domain-containing protein [Verrucomicrobiae bacterium]
MTWSFLAPLYLLGGIALAVPIWAHLRSRQPKDVYAFSSLFFLLPSRLLKTNRWRQIMRWLVLLLRMAVMTALALAFAKPWRHAILPPTGKAAVLVLDVSCSMRAGKVWEEARNLVLKKLSEENREAATAVVLMGRTARLLAPFEQPLAEKEAVLKNLTPAFEGTDPLSAILQANSLLTSQSAKGKKILVFSDMAVSAWKTIKWESTLSPGVTIEPCAVAPTAPANVAVTEVSPPRSFWQTNAVLTVTATFRNFSAESREAQAFCLVNEKTVGEQNLFLPGHGSQEISFHVMPQTLEPLCGSVRCQCKDELAEDNERFFVVPACKPARIGRLGRSRPDEEVFLKTVFTPKANTLLNRYQWVSLDPESTMPIGETVDMLILDQGLAVSPVMQESVKKFVNGGGPILVFLGEASQLLDWENTWLPVEIGSKRRSGTLSEAQRFAWVHHGHPILKPFFLPRGGDLFLVKVFAWRAFRAPLMETLISLPNGDPIFAVLGQENRQAAMLAFPFTREWSDWPVQATFLPMIYQTVEWLLQQNKTTGEYLAGHPLPTGQSAKGPGFQRADKGPSRVFAVNIDPLESDLSRWTLLENFKQLENPNRDLAPATVRQPVKTVDGVDSSPSSMNLIWWLLLLAVLFSLPELCLANHTPR